jgi:hypothetical protein
MPLISHGYEANSNLHDWVITHLAILFYSPHPPQKKKIETFYIQRIYLLLIDTSLCSSLDPLFHSDSIIHHKSSQRKINDAFPYY